MRYKIIGYHYAFDEQGKSYWTSSSIMWRGYGERCTCPFLPFPHLHTGGRVD